MLGKRLGNFRIERELGRGGMGVVYQAFDSALERKVALKVLPSHLADHPEIVARFRKEALAAARLAHPGIVEIHSIGCEEGVHFFVMELVEGESLERMLEKSGPLPPDYCLGLLRPVAEALDYAHRRGFIHRDIKPSNIMVDPGRNAVKLTDFGIAKALEGGTQLTSAEARIGTPRYMSPEQVRGAALDPRSDIFSLGIVLFRMLAGRDPFEGPSFLVVMRKILEEECRFTPEEEARIPPAPRAIARRALAKDPALRYQRAGDLVRDIDAALKSPDRAPGPGKKRWLAPAGAAAVAAAGLALLLFRHPEIGRSKEPPADSSPRGAAAAATPDEYLFWFNQGVEALAAQHWNAAIAALARAAKIRSTPELQERLRDASFHKWAHAGREADAVGQLQAAALYLEKALTFRPGDPGVSAEVASIKKRAGAQDAGAGEQPRPPLGSREKKAARAAREALEQGTAAARNPIPTPNSVETLPISPGIE